MGMVFIDILVPCDDFTTVYHNGCSQLPLIGQEDLYLKLQEDFDDFNLPLLKGTLMQI